MPGRLTAAAHGRRRAGSILLVGASAATLVLAQAATAVAAPTVTSTASQAQQPLSAAQAAQLSQNVSQHVIVFLKDQPPAARAGSAAARIRSNAVAASQSPVLSELRQVHATHVRPYRLVNAFAATVSAGEEARLKANTSVQRVIPDAMIQGPAAPAAPTGPASPAALATLPGACTSAANGELEPEALSLTHTDSDTGTNTARSLGFDGSGVQVAFLADGLDPNNVNFIRPDAKSVFDSSIGGDYTDFSGDGVGAVTGGAEAFLDANAIAGQGSHVYNAQNFSAQPQPAACNIRIEGVAPGASLVGLDVFSAINDTTTSNFLNAINFATTVHPVNVINESFGADPLPDTSADAIKQFDDTAVAAGITVVVSSGDAGPFNSIGSPATDPKVISVGASTDFRFYAITNYGEARTFAKTGWLNDNISSLSSGGFSQTGRTIDMVAPGDLSFASCSTNTAIYTECTNFVNQASPIEESGGTSQSSPLTAGAAALVIQAYKKTHSLASPSPALIKQILTSTATDLGAPAYEQGAGLLNSFKAVQLAESINGGTPTGSTLATSTSQLNAVGSAGTAHHWTVTVTNESTATQTVTLSGRRFGAPTNVTTGTVTLSNTLSPHLTNYQGLPANYGVLHFSVRRDRLPGQIRRGQQRAGAADPDRPEGPLRGSLAAARRGQLRQRRRHQPGGGHLDRGHLQPAVRFARRDRWHGPLRGEHPEVRLVRHAQHVEVDPQACGHDRG